MKFHSWISSKKKSRKWSAERIKERFDADAHVFAQMDSGQEEIVDVALMRELVVEAAASSTPWATRILDVGCGSGLYAHAMALQMPHLHITLLDFSRNMLDCAAKRLGGFTPYSIQGIVGDIREVELEANAYDIVLSSAVLHHLREDSEWELVFEKLFNCIAPGGSLWIADIVDFEHHAVHELMRHRYETYLTSLHGAAYSSRLLKFIAKEDSPKPLLYQINLLRKVGFESVDILHNNMCFAAFGAIKNNPDK